ncbi:MAG TPA: flagellar motor switch protein FliG [Candidatus Nanopelagicaceae bacterium]|nr:flagellar motor switch protein FliG [Candidatus Nanopelagicaceae bacterium]
MTQTAPLELEVELTGLRKAAILIVQLGQGKASRILAELREGELEELVAEVARLRSVDSSVVDMVFEEFRDIIAAHRYVAQGGLNYARELLEGGLGADRARDIMARLEAAISEMPFQFLRRTDPRLLLSFLHDEHPQTIALVMSHMSADQASMVLSGLAPGLQADVAHRIAIMDQTSPEIVQRVEETLQRRMSSLLQPSELSVVGGLQPLIEIINRSDRGTERMILEGLDGLDPALAEAIRAHMFMFEDIVGLEDRYVQLVLQQVDTADLAHALKGVKSEVREKVMKNISQRAAENLEEEIDLLGPVRVSAVEEAQAKIVRNIRALEETGQIVILRGGDDEYLS